MAKLLIIFLFPYKKNLFPHSPGFGGHISIEGLDHS